MSKPPASIPRATGLSELGICLFEYDRQNGRIYKVLGSWEWFEDPGFSILPEITKITGITDEMVAGHRIDDRAVNDLLSRIVLVVAHNADFDRRFLENGFPSSPINIGRAAVPILIGKPRASAHLRSNSSLTRWVLSRRAYGCERLSSDTPYAGATAPRHRAAGVAGSLETSEIADMAVMGKGRRH
jgi:hypothetical protein